MPSYSTLWNQDKKNKTYIEFGGLREKTFIIEPED